MTNIVFDFATSPLTLIAIALLIVAFI